MSKDTGRASDDASADALQEYVVLDTAASCQADAVAEIVGKAIRQFQPADPSDGFIQGAMHGVVRGVLGTHMDARKAARGAIEGVMRAVRQSPDCSRLAAFSSAARALILETSTQGGRFDATVRGILDAALCDASTGLTRRQVMSVVSTAILDATMESMRRQVNRGDTSRWIGPRCTSGGGECSERSKDLQPTGAKWHMGD